MVCCPAEKFVASAYGYLTRGASLRKSGSFRRKSSQRLSDVDATSQGSGINYTTVSVFEHCLTRHQHDIDCDTLPIFPQACTACPSQRNARLSSLRR